MLTCVATVTKALAAADTSNVPTVVVAPRLAGFVLDAFAGDPVLSNQESGGDPELDELSSRKRQVIRLIARG